MKLCLKITLIPAVALCWMMLSAPRCAAQGMDEFRRRLALPEVVGEGGATASVHVTETPDAAAAVARGTSRNGGEVSFQGYRVGIYSGNDSKAQENSLAAKERFEQEFSDINVYWVYDNPYFKVTAGDCLTEEEAVMLLARVRRLFPKAYVVRAGMTLDNIVIREHGGHAPEDEADGAE